MSLWFLLEAIELLALRGRFAEETTTRGSSICHESDRAPSQ